MLADPWQSLARHRDRPCVRRFRHRVWERCHVVRPTPPGTVLRALPIGPAGWRREWGLARLAVIG